MEGSNARLRAEHNARAWLVYHIDGLRRSKRLPKLKDLQIKDDTPKPRQTWEEQLRNAMLWHAVTAKRKDRLNG